MKIRSIAGSLRRASLSRATAAVAGELAPAGVSLEPLSIRDLPHYDGDLDVDGGPAAVATFKAAIAEADGLLIVTPEYNYGIPGVLKNALDWASRPAYHSVLAHKPVAMVGISGGPSGGARALAQLRQVLGGTVSEVFPYPETLIAEAHRKFEGGVLVDDATRSRLERLVQAYGEWIDTRGLGAPLRRAS